MLNFDERQALRKARSDAKLRAINEIAERTARYRQTHGKPEQPRRSGPLAGRYPAVGPVAWLLEPWALHVLVHGATGAQELRLREGMTEDEVDLTLGVSTRTEPFTLEGWLNRATRG